jgi:transglutaminase-like putative cysteine protease
MNLAREKRLLVGVIAVLAPLPLPFASVIAWPVLLAYWLVCGLYLARAHRGAESWLPAWAMNLLAIAYMPVLLADLSFFWRGQVLQPLVHLALFTLAVKLFALKREADKWHALLGAFFLYLAAMGSSVHPSVVIYQIAMLACWLFVMARLAGWHEASKSPVAARLPVPLAGFVTVATLATLLGAVPLFALLPRFRQPYIAAPASRSEAGQMTGFSDHVTLDTIGRVRSSNAVAFRFTLDGLLQLREFRFKESTYDLFRDNAWRRGPRPSIVMRRSPEGWFRLSQGRPRSWMEVWQGRSTGIRLPLPVESVALELATRAVSLDDSGVASLLVDGGGFTFRAGLEDRPASSWEVSARQAPLPSELDTARVTQRMEALAAEVMGVGTPLERAGRLEGYLRSSYRYALDLGDQPTDRPIERFLFETRAGHCEYFATSMVLLLRSQGIPARLVTGYYGAELNPLEGYFIVRLSNAHAWVEGWLPEAGWRMFDPTPAAGMPALDNAESWRRLWGQAWDYLVFRWDRYVLTYGFADQADFFFRFRDLLARLWDGFRDSPDERREIPSSDPESPAVSAPAEPPSGPAWESLRWLPMAAVAVGLGLWLWHAQKRPSATAAYSWLRRELVRRQVRLSDSTPPLEVERRLARRWPEARPDAAVVIRFYLAESFGGVGLEADEQAEVAGALRSVRQALGRRRPRGVGP